MHKSWLRTTALILALALLLAACGGPGDVPGNGPGNGPANGPDGLGETVDSVIVTQDDEPQLYALRGGRYRVSWTHSCAAIAISFQQEDGTPVYERSGRARTFSAIVSNVSPGHYQFTQTDPECERYEIRLSRL